MFPTGSFVDRLISLALDEDLNNGDVTTRCCIPEGHRSSARILAREQLVFCGGPILNRIAEVSTFGLRWHCMVAEGVLVGEGDTVAVATGDTRELLSLERTSLNFLQRLSGVATYTATVVRQAHGLVVLDTRKTMPGWRMLDKYATRIGGARNHRGNLGEMILIKNNHIDANQGNLHQLFEQLNRERPWYTPVECEVRSREELQAVLPYNPDFILLDNMNDELLVECLSVMRESGFSGGVEASGGISRERLVRLAASGVSAVSMGALTTQAPSVDISMRLSGDQPR
jgi:nicotinate-nucleotide pyrophosphorylase (carboxylating)